MGLTVYTEPTQEPITVIQAKDHCIIDLDLDDDDEMIAGMIAAARVKAETITRRALPTATFQLTLDAFPDGREAIELPNPPLISVGFISYLDDTGELVTMDGADYVVDVTSTPGRIVPAFGGLWPTTRDMPSAVTIRFTAGYAADVMPAPAVQAIKLMVGHWYKNRETVGDTAMAEMPMGACFLLSSLKWGSYP